MQEEKQKKLNKNGWSVGNTDDFLLPLHLPLFQISNSGKYLCRSQQTGQIYWGLKLDDIVNMPETEANAFVEGLYPIDAEVHKPCIVVGESESESVNGFCYWFLYRDLNDQTMLNYADRPTAVGYAQANAIKDFNSALGNDCKIRYVT